jgi:hypothetical protein
VLEAKDRRGSLPHLGELADVALYVNDRQMHEVLLSMGASVRDAILSTGLEAVGDAPLVGASLVRLSAACAAPRLPSLRRGAHGTDVPAPGPTRCPRCDGESDDAPGSQG